MRASNERLQIAALTSVAVGLHGKNSWAHTLHYICQALQRYSGDITYLGPMDAPAERLCGKVVDIAAQALLHKRYMYFHSLQVARRFGNIGASRLKRADHSFDVVLAGGAVDIAFLETDIPIAMVVDATHARVCQYYPAYSNLVRRSCWELDTLEELAIQKAALLLYTSRWAAQSAIEDYHADPRKVHVVPFGADLDDPPDRAAVFEKRQSDRCRLLFLGVDWKRKGGDIAFETLIALEACGIEAELIVCGCTPPNELSHPRMQVIPFLNKRDERQRKELEALYLTADFLLLPTRCECYGMVFCEAAAYGLPVVTTRTGGVSEIVRDGETGFMLPLSARGDAYARVIAEVYGNEARYGELVRASRQAFEDRLNWDAWGKTAKDLMTEITGRGAEMTLPMPDAREYSGHAG
ncbi:MAG: hypothetical protein PVSMB4_07340 [Ktedonobacterales bacterium]